MTIDGRAADGGRGVALAAKLGSDQRHKRCLILGFRIEGHEPFSTGGPEESQIGGDYHQVVALAPHVLGESQCGMQSDSVCRVDRVTLNVDQR